MIHDDRIAALGQFRDSIVVPLKNTDAEKWPIRSGRVVRLVADCLAREFFADLKSLQDRGLGTGEIAKLFGTPTRLWRLSHHLLQGLRAMHVSVREQQDAVLQLLGLIAELKVGSAFLLDGANLVLTGGAARALAENPAMNDTRGAPGRAINQWSHRTAAVLWSYAEALYFVAHEVGVEIHGPYRIREDEVLVVRDYFNLRPVELWPELDNFLGFGSLRIATIYNDFRGHFDVYNNLYTEPDVSLPTHAMAVAVWMDGVPLAGEAEFRALWQRAGELVTRVAAIVETWPLVEIARRYVDIFWWRKRELALAARRQWRPEAAVVARIMPGAIPPAAASSTTEQQLLKQFDLTQEHLVG